MPDRSPGKRVDVLEQTVFGPDGVMQQVGALRQELSGTRTEMRAEFAAVRDEMRTEFAALRGEMKAAIAQTHVHMRVLHEEVIARLAVIGESSALATSSARRPVGRLVRGSIKCSRSVRIKMFFRRRRSSSRSKGLAT